MIAKVGAGIAAMDYQKLNCYIQSQSKNVEKPTFQEMPISAVFAADGTFGCKEGEPRIKAAD